MTRINAISRLTLALALWGAASGCSSTYFKYQNVPFRQNAAMQAQLGNLGIRGDADQYGFQKGAFLSECGIRELDVSVDAKMPQVKAGQAAFGPDATLTSIGRDLGYTRDELEKMSIVIFSVSPIELAERLKQGLSPKCQKYIEKSRENARFVTSTAVVLDFDVLRNTTADLDVEASLAEKGNVAMSARLGETKSLSVSPAAVFAYRYSRLCWREGNGSDVTLMVDDQGFTACPDGYEAEPPSGWRWASVQPRQQEPSKVEEKAEASY